MSQERAIERLGNAKSDLFQARAAYTLTDQFVTDKRLLAKFDKLASEVETLQRELSELKDKS